MIEKGQRKERSDRKRDIKPYIPIELKNSIYRLAFITSTPVKKIGEELCIYGINKSEIIENLSKDFRRDIRINNTYYRGDITNSPSSRRIKDGEIERISMRLTSPVYDVISAVAYALDCRPARACSKLMIEGFQDINFLNEYAKRHLTENLDKKRMAELRKVLKYINKENSDSFNWAGLLSYIVDEVKTPVASTKELVNEFIVNHWRNN